ncbi:MAG: 5'-methylthioadenosine/S-adenosylhomocysteine nucleosidase [Gammaproteobacteria bacterium]
MTKIKLYCNTIMFCICMFFTLSCFASSRINFGIVTALHSEAIPIISGMNHVKIKTISHIHYYLGDINHKKVVLVVGGVGGINAAIATTELIKEFNPHYIIFSGSAGGISKNLNVGDIVISKQAYLVDFGSPTSIKPTIQLPELDPIRNEPVPLVFYGSKMLLEAANNITKLPLPAHDIKNNESQAKIIPGKIATSEFFPDNEIDIKRIEKNNVAALEMEGAAVLKTCWILNKPGCLIVRGISDLVHPANKYAQWNVKNQTIANKNAASVTIGIIKAVA